MGDSCRRHQRCRSSLNFVKCKPTAFNAQAPWRMRKFKNMLVVSKTTAKKGYNYPVGHVLLGFFVFVVIGSCEAYGLALNEWAATSGLGWINGLAWIKNG
ncbi:hypothetical protein LguiB_001497 [Lonicera macranthoides]